MPEFPIPLEVVCSIAGCERLVECRGWCHKHYERWRTHGNPLCPRPRMSFEQRFWAKVDQDGPLLSPYLGRCWLWMGWTPGGVRGYGSIERDGKRPQAHRVAYELVAGVIPEGLTLDHLCRTPPCVNPAHLEPVTQRENTMRGRTIPAANARKTHCPHGHPYSPENTYRTPDGSRKCRVCLNARRGVRR